MTKTVTAGEEYSLKKQTSTPKKIAKVLIGVWTLGVVAPAVWFSFTKADVIKQYALVKTVGTLDSVLQTQYTALTNNVISKINISKYTSQIKVPTVNLDGVSEKAEKVQKASSALSKLGLKNADVVESSTKVLQEKINKVNTDLQKNVQGIQKTLETDIQTALKKELSGLAGMQIQKQLGLSQTSYNRLVKGDYGLMGETSQKTTASLYQELSKSNLSFLKQTKTFLDKYFVFLKWGLTVLVGVILLIPAWVVWWIAKKLSATFTECPYCHKVFISKKGKLGILKLFKN